MRHVLAIAVAAALFGALLTLPASPASADPGQDLLDITLNTTVGLTNCAVNPQHLKICADAVGPFDGGGIGALTVSGEEFHVAAAEKIVDFVKDLSGPAHSFHLESQEWNFDVVTHPLSTIVAETNLHFTLTKNLMPANFTCTASISRILGGPIKVNGACS